MPRNAPLFARNDSPYQRRIGTNPYKMPTSGYKRPEERKNVRFYRPYHIYVSFRFNLGFLSTRIYTCRLTISTHNSGIHIYTCQPFALFAFGYPYQTRKSRLAIRKTAFILRGPFSSEGEVFLRPSITNQHDAFQWQLQTSVDVERFKEYLKEKRQFIAYTHFVFTKSSI
jgi:hypothetical protein